MSLVQPASVEGFACDLNAFTPEQREHHLAHVETLFGAVPEVRELPDGYAVRAPELPDILAQLADFIAHERICCPFLSFGVDVAPNNGPVWLRITGPDGVKAPLAADLFGVLRPDVLNAAGLR